MFAGAASLVAVVGNPDVVLVVCPVAAVVAVAATDGVHTGPLGDRKPRLPSAKAGLTMNRW